MRIRIFAIAILACTFFATPNLAQSANDLFQQALVKERADGDLKAAIALYERVVAVSTDRSLSARALVQIGKSYEKLGLTAAVAAYQRVLVDYADQSALVDEARLRLAAMTALTPANDRDVASLAVRQVWSGPDLPDNGSISLDGRYMAFVDIMYEYVMVRDMRTGTIRRLPNVDQDIGSGSVYAPIISPDGNWVVFPVQLTDNDRCDLWIVRSDGRDPRLLYSDDSVQWIEVKSWAGDGEKVLAVFHGKGDASIASVEVKDGAATVLKRTSDVPSHMSYSADGRFIVYDRKVDAESADRDIYVLTTDTLEETVLIERPGEDLVLGWAPDGKHILLASNRSGSTGVWLQEIDEATAIGEPKLVKTGFWRAIPVGFTRDGAFYYHQRTSVRDVYRAEVDFRTGTLIGVPSPLDLEVAGQNQWPVISPDGRFVAFQSERGTPSSIGSSSYWRNTRFITIHALKTGISRTLTPDVEEFSVHSWYKDSQSLTVRGKCGEASYRCQSIVDVDTGSSRVWDTREWEGPGSIFAISPDGKQVFFTQWDGSDRSILAREPESGEQRVLRTGPGSWAEALSPDGQYIATAEFQVESEPGRILIIPVAGGAPREVLRFEKGSAKSVDWTPDMQRLVYIRERELWDVPVSGGPPRLLGELMDWMGNLRVHPDGRQIFFDAEPYNAEVWVIENLVAALGPTAIRKRH